MKKQINPNIKAHLIRSAFYVILLLAVCVIPFALAQRNIIKRSAPHGASDRPSSIRQPGEPVAQPRSKATVGTRFSHAPRSGVSRPGGPPPICGLLVGSGMTLGFEPNGWNPTLATNTVDYTFSNSQAAPNEFALFETHDPWGFTTIKDAITANGHTYTEFTPADLAGFDFSQYSVVVLNWDDTFTPDFIADYTAAIPALEAYINAGGVVWVQSAIQGCDDPVPMPFGGQGDGCDFSNNDPVVDPASPMMTGMPNPIPGNSASHLSYTTLPGGAHIVVITETTGNPALYDFRPGGKCGPTPTPGPCTLGPWNIVANYPLVSESVSVSTDGVVAYAAGGFDGINFVPTDQFNQYDPVADTWTPLTNVPVAFYDAPSVYAANTNSIYIFGGIDINGVPRDIVQIYNVGTGTWTSGTPMPDPTGRYFASAAYDATSGKIYVIGGFDGATFSEQTNNWIYDPVTDTWDSSTAAPIPVAMGGAGYSIVGQNIYLAGHWNGGLASTDHYRYDIVANAWTAMAPVPVPIYRPASGAIETNTYLVGGGDPFIAPGKARKASKRPTPRHPSMAAPATSYSSTYVYDTLADTWSTGPSTNVAHSFTGGTAIDHDLIVVTGFDGGGDTNTVELAHCGPGGPSPTPTATPTPGTPTPTPTPGGSCPPVITQSTSQDIVSGNSVACNDGFGHTDNSYWRAFNMNEFTGGQAYNVTSVDFGIELAQSGDGTGQPLTVNLYANHGAPFPGGDWQSNLIATSGSINIPDQSLTIFNQPITVTVPAGTLELVFEVFTPNGQAVGNLFFVGSNPDPETAFSYLSAADCGVTVPTPTGDIGFPNMHIVFNVNGSCGGTPTPSPSPSVTPSATPTATPSATPTATPSVTPSVTPTATPTATPGHSPTPRPRPTPHPRPTP